MTIRPRSFGVWRLRVEMALAHSGNSPEFVRAVLAESRRREALREAFLDGKTPAAAARAVITA